MNITKVKVGQGTKQVGSDGDIWALTWADDNAIYAANCDTYGYPKGLYKSGRNIIIVRISNGPEQPILCTLNPMEQFLAINNYHTRLGSWKASGMLCVKSKLFLAAFHHRYPHEIRRFPWWTASDACIIVSENYGASWTHFPETPMFGASFGNPSFIQFGQNYGDALDEYVYAVSGAQGRWTNNDQYVLGRVPQDAVADEKSWSFYTGGSDGNPKWGPIKDAQPILESPYGLGCSPEVIYNSRLQLYLLATFSVLNLPLGSVDYKVAEQAHKQTIFHLFQSRQPWGPWTRIYKGRGPGMANYCPRIPCKWLENDGKSAWIVSAGNPWRFPEAEEHYGFVTSKLSLDIDQAGEK